MSKTSDFLKRDNLISTKEVVCWWNKGRLFLNFAYLLFCILHLIIVWFFLKNGWIFFYIPMLCVIGIAINIVFSLGLLAELVVRGLKFKFDFNKLAPTIKVSELIFIGFVLLILSAWDILRQI